MGFPSVRSQASTDRADATTLTTHPFDLPASVASDDLLLVVVWFNGNAAITWDNTTAGSWTQLFRVNNSTNFTLAAYWKKADGTESGQTLSVTTASAHRSTSQSFAVMNVADDGLGGLVAPERATSFKLSDSTFEGAALTPSWGSDDVLWMTFAACNSINKYVSGPASYSSPTFSRVLSSTLEIVAAWRQLAAATETPGTITFSTTLSGYSLNVGVLGGAGGAPSSRRRPIYVVT